MESVIVAVFVQGCMEVENFIKVLLNWENFLAVWEVVLGEIEIYKYVFNQDP